MIHITVLGQEEAAIPQSACASHSCGSTAQQLYHLPQSIRQRVLDHPCYSEEAHHHFARMHVAVAPACNIQCHYCNRKYDCANESRPGVVSELLTPEQAVKKTLAVADAIPQMTVLGIAGPGEPLANRDRTFATFRMIAEQAPDIKLCVSTNGLALPDCVEELAQLNIEHVTITINCIDPDVGAQIYPWIYWQRKRIRGREGAAILIERQQLGLEMLVKRDILVKVNSVMIPGVNDEHLIQVSKTVKSKGAFLHNVMPLISEPEHGTFFGLMGQRGPTPAELQELQDACAGDMNMMRHCRQCRADAVGLLGEDRGAEFTMDKIENMEIDYPAAMEKRARLQEELRRQTEAKQRTESMVPTATGRPVLMAVASKGGGIINQHFGHAREFLVYEASPVGVRFVGHRKTDLYCSGGDTCGETESNLDKTIRALEGCEVVLCSRIGIAPWEALEALGIQPSSEHALERIEAAVAAAYNEMAQAGRLTQPTARGLAG